MQFKQILKASLKPGRNIFVTLVMVGVVASGLFVVPTLGESKTSAATCANAPEIPTFNYWPVTFADDNVPLCHDFPAIDAALYNSDPQFSQSEADWNDGLTLADGQTGAALMYIHNGAANSLDPAITTAKGVKIKTETDTTVGASHQIKVTYTSTSSNVAAYTKSFTVKTPANAKLEVIPNSGFMYDYDGRLILDQQNLNLGNSTFDLGDLDACFEYSLFLTFKFKVVTPITPPTNTTLSIDKSVKNLTVDGNTGRGAVYYSSVNAKQNEKVGYKIVVTNTGTTVAQNVTVTDNSVSGITVDSGSTTVGNSDDSLLANDLWQGAIPGTVNVGNLQPGESRVIKYTGRVNVNSGSLVNTATAVATNASQVQDTATVIVTNNPGNPNLSIQKWVKNNNNNTAYADSVDAKTNEWVNFKITITNTGNSNLTSARITDAIPAGLEFENSVVSDGTVSFNNNTLTVSYGSAIPAGQSKTVEFAAQVKASTASTICNIAVGTGNNVTQVQDNACVRVITNPHPSNHKISIKKWVKNNSTSTSYSDSSVEARTGERVNFKVTVTNTGDTTLSNVRMTDRIPDGLQFDDSVTGDGTRSINGSTFTVDFGNISEGQSKTVEFSAKVLATGSTTICNLAKANANNVSEVSDDACVRIYTTPKPGESNIVLSKRAFNDTKNVDATITSAARGDYITYTLVTRNNGTADKTNYVISDDLSQVLPLADMVSTNGGTVSGNTITYPAMTIKAGETVTKTFKVRIKQTLNSELTYQLNNTYGNTIVINVPGNVIFVPPVTGAAGTSAAAFAGLITAGFVIARKRGSILKFIFN